MQTIHFSCPHCKNLMAVGMNLLGRNVRCPHCKQVAQAPVNSPAAAAPAPVRPPAPAPAPAPTPPAPDVPQFDVPGPGAESPESIFGEAHEDDVFGRPQPKPTLPPIDHLAQPTAPSVQPYAPRPQLDPPAPAAAPHHLASPETAPKSSPSTWNDPTVSEMQPPPQNTWGPDPTAPIEALDDGRAQQAWPPQPEPYQLGAVSAPAYPAPVANPWPGQPDGLAEYTPASEPAAAAPTPARPNPLRRDLRRTPTGGKAGVANQVTWLFLAWAVAATAGLLYLMFGRSNGPSEPAFLSVPDFFGEYDRSERDRKKTSWRGLPSVEDVIPPQLRVRVGHALQVGDQLQVEPLTIERRILAVYQKAPGAEPQKVREMPGPVYVLRLRVKNTSADVSFCPNDPAFNRRPRRDETQPYNALVVGQQRFPGGPFYWPSPNNSVEREFVTGQEKDHLPLAPGEERETVVCSAPQPGIERALHDLKEGPLLWRVQLRRGLVRCEDRSGTMRDVSVTAVIGVDFKPTDVQNKVEVN